MITPGPWNIGSQKEDGLLQIIAGDAAHEITGVGSGPFDVVALVKTEANAHAIAALPELIDALHRLLIEYRALKGLDDDAATNEAVAALRKAKGE